MANQEHLDIFRQGAEVWNKWREENSDILPDLSNLFLPHVDLHQYKLTNTRLFRARLAGADLHSARLNITDLGGADLSKANLTGADLIDAPLSGADLSETNLYSANLSGANLSRANLCDADLREATLYQADLRQAKCCTADFRKANLSEADLTWSILSEANLNGANLTACAVYAISAWGVQLKNTIQTGLIITDATEPTITVDNLELAQFIYLLLNNAKIREIIDTITSKVVLILGRFTPERKAILDALRDELRKQNYTLVLFDIEKPASRKK